MNEALAAGARIGSYEIIDRLGAGGMGEVYRARDTRLGRTVALKVLRSGADPELLHRLDREARAASALNHPNIVHIYDVGVAAAGGGRALRRDGARGGRDASGADFRAAPCPYAEMLDLGAQLTDGLAKAHRAGIVHRDLKPENLMITRRRGAEDPGLRPGQGRGGSPGRCRGRNETLSRHGTQVGMLLGTLEYMSPEQASGRPVDHRTDQFSVGPHPLEMATGHAGLPPRYARPGAGRRDRARGGAAQPAACGRAPRRSRRWSPGASRRTPSDASRGPTSWPRTCRRWPTAPARARWPLGHRGIVGADLGRSAPADPRQLRCRRSPAPTTCRPATAYAPMTKGSSSS